MLLFLDLNESDGLGICSLTSSAAPSGWHWHLLGGAVAPRRWDANVVVMGKRFTRSLQQNILLSEIVYQVSQQRWRRPYSSSGDMGDSCCIFKLWVGGHTFGWGQQRGALSHLERLWVSLKIEREREKNIVLKWLLGIASGRGRLQLQMCWMLHQLSWSIQYLCCCPQYLFQTAWAIAFCL